MNASIRSKQNEAPSRTTLYSLPLEMLDSILQKSYMHWLLNSSTRQRNEEVIRSLISVDVCFNRRITKKRFKKTIWRCLTDFYGKAKKRSAIIRNNRNYFVDNIKPTTELMAALLSHNCITEEQAHFIQRQRYTRDKNDTLLYVMESVDETYFSCFVTWLQHTNQKTVAKIMENGGGVIKIKVHTRGSMCATSIEAHLFHKRIEDLRSKVNPRSRPADKLVTQLREEGIEILSSQLDRQTVVVWTWCRTQAALEHVQKLYETNQLREIFFEIIQTSISTVIDVDKNQFEKTVVVCPISINFTQRIEMPENEHYFFGVTKLRNEIYVLCRSPSPALNEIRVFEDRTPFRLQKEIEIKEILLPWDIVSNEKEKCLYVSDFGQKCVSKITRETNDQHKIIKWLTTDYKPRTLSVSSDGQLLMVNDSSHCLMIYGPDAEFIQSILFPSHIIYPRHAVETSIGNFVIIHNEEQEDKVMEEVKHKVRLERKKRKVGSYGRRKDVILVVSELDRDGQMVNRRFIPSNEPRQLNFNGYYLSLDSDDRVFMTDRESGRVILLASDLKWNRILCPTKEENEATRIREPFRLCYDKEMKQLIVGGYDTTDINVYTLSRY